ncbi:hypothetical protein [Mycobacterium sp. E735]|uniref:hypothetical protein n=1 Tax=Mycobacterium sp. E735 TaxID=1834148 RepID=UPI0012E9B2D9|nr:hypothetical protein [Mycobacterium sp. E735]
MVVYGPRSCHSTNDRLLEQQTREFGIEFGCKQQFDHHSYYVGIRGVQRYQHG